MRLILSIMMLMACSCSSGPKQSSKLENEPQLELKAQPFSVNHKNHIRGLIMVNDRVAWASGAGGRFMRCVDGEQWIVDTIPGYTHLDFRDVHAFDRNTALLMAAGDEGRILRTDNSGESWVEVYTDLREGIFLDGMDFHANVGYCYGDPINGKMVILKSEDFGNSWFEVDSFEVPSTLPGEAGYAASGTGVVADEKMTYIATGGSSVARVFSQYPVQNGWSAFDTPMRSDEGCGIFSMTSTKSNLGAGGGWYLDSTSTEGNCAVSSDRGKTWKLITENQPRGYRSCVAYSSKSNLMVACGRTGVDYSLDEGFTWNALSDKGYYTVTLGDSTGWLMGRGGKLAKLSW